MRLISLLLIVGLSFSASAVSLKFDFRVNSSGTSMYACNAGLKHSSYSSRVCYDRRDLSSCSQATCSDGDLDCNCVCTGDNDGNGDGEYRLDFMKVKLANWADNGKRPTGIQNFTVNAGTNSYAVAVADNRKFKKQILDLSYNLGSERYGAKYYVDICFRAPQIDYTNVSGLNWAIKRSVTVTDIAGANTNDNFDLNNSAVTYSDVAYQTLASLEVESALYCKTKSGDVVFNEGSGWKDFSTSQVIKFTDKNTKEDLKGCYFRYSFQETEVDGTDSIRRWSKQQTGRFSS